jgi:anti-sigma factor RsiW
MTDQERPKKQRWSKRAVRATAWTAAATAFISALGALGAAPNPAAADQPTSKAPRKIIVRRIIKKVVILGQEKPAPVHVVYTGGGSTTGSAPAPAPAPVTTGGSHP